ncbi:sugar phosphate nucleotidyltransferase [Devosia sp.]|uniref:sugar phosphate nucleotidyltransferase n=1 Tax=Devosia sp. TaxID=1871048 RepID=UPI003263D085
MTDRADNKIHALPLLVLAGGFGTRLKTVVSDVPKPLAPVDGKPHLEHMIEFWRLSGVRHFVFLLHYEAQAIIAFLQQHWTSPEMSHCTLDWVIEDEPLGTGGAITNALTSLSITGDFLVTNADTWLGGGIADVADTDQPAIAVVGVPNAERYGSVDIEAGLVRRFSEKSAATGPGMVNAGLYKLGPDILAAGLPRSFSLERDYLPLLVQNGRLRAVAVDANFIDIGIPSDYLRFQRWVQQGKAGPI